MAVAQRIAVVATVAAAGVLVAAAPAQAMPLDIIDVVGTEIFVTGALSAGDFIVIQRWTSDSWSFTEFAPHEIASTSPACYYDDPASHHQMVCVVPGLTRIHVKTLGGEDTVNNFSPAPVEVELGDGDDWANLGGEPGITSSVLGGNGNDTVSSGAGNDAINGGPGTDTVTLGAFTYPSLDPTLPYAGVAYPVVASLTSGTAQRWPLDTDTLTQVENLTSGPANDTLTGDSSANVLDSGSGRDTVDGRAGNDILRGGADRDLIVGGTGADQVYGGYGDDDLLGGDGDDRLYGEDGIDRLTGEVGLDRCYTGETVSCELIL